MDMIALAVNIWSVIVGAVHDGVALLLGAFSWIPTPWELFAAHWPLFVMGYAVALAGAGLYIAHGYLRR